MISLYAIQFRITPPQGDELNTVRNLKEMVRRWVSSTRRMEGSVLPGTPGDYLFNDDQRVIITEEATPDYETFLWTLTWRHPDDNDWRITRVSVCQIAGHQNELEFSLRQHAESGSDDFALSPRDTKVRFGRPAVVPLIIRRYDCTHHTRPLRSVPTVLYAEDIPGFVQNTLFSNDRHLPAVVFSIDPRTGSYVGTPDTVADYLGGLAEVYTLSDIPTSYELTTQLGKTLSCYNGAARIYYPGFSLRSDYEDCPLYLAESLAFLPHDYSFARKLLRLFSSVAVMRFAPGAIFRQVENILAAQRQFLPPEIIEQHQQMNSAQTSSVERSSGERSNSFAVTGNYGHSGSAGSSGISTGMGAMPAPPTSASTINVTWDEATLNRVVEARVDQYREEVRRLHSRVHALENQLNGLSDQLAELVEDDEILPDSGKFADVSEAVSQAELDFGDVLIFHEKAHRSADRSPYAMPDRVYDALQAMFEVGELRRNANINGESIGALEDLFSERGVTYTARISQTSRGQYGHEYEIMYDGEKRTIHEHLVLGKGSPKTCLRIHFFWDEMAQSFVIGHVGRHKTNTRS
jgi:hypothetical protein